MFRITFTKNTAVAFSPNGEYLAATGEDETVRLWKVNGWQEMVCIRHELRHGHYPVTSIAFSPDSKYLATANHNKTVKVWQVPSGREISCITHKDYVKAVTFSRPDGKYLATASGDSTVQLWLWRPEDLIDKAHSRLSRNLTAEEWQQYLGDES